MKTLARGLTVAGALAAGLGLAFAAPAHGQGAGYAGPPLADGVQPAQDWARPKTAYVVASDTPLYRVAGYDPAQQTGETLKRGQRPQVLAEANQGLYLLIGRNGQGVGYAPRGLLCPAAVCREIKD